MHFLNSTMEAESSIVCKGIVYTVMLGSRAKDQQGDEQGNSGASIRRLDMET